MAPLPDAPALAAFLAAATALVLAGDRPPG
jgi:hypothetical protein